MDPLRHSIMAALGVAFASGGTTLTAKLMASRPEPPAITDRPLVPEVTVMKADPCVFAAPIIAYGTIRPSSQVRVIPEVTGTVTHVHPSLAVGRRIRKGDVLVQIDSRHYASQVVQIEAEIEALTVRLERQRQQEQNLTARLELARQRLNLAKSDVDRNQTLLDQNVATQSELEAATHKRLQVQDTVLAYEGQLDLIPYLQEEVAAALEASRARLADARRQVEATTIRCPFDARIDGVSVGASQVAVAGSIIVVLTNLEAFELAASLHPSDLRWLDRLALAQDHCDGTAPATPAAVTWASQSGGFSWAGQVTRLQGYDETTRTARLVIEIPNLDHGIAASGVAGAPRLSIGMFCRVEIATAPLRDALLVPRAAVREDSTVYVFEQDTGAAGERSGKLALRRVPILRESGGYVLVDHAGRNEDRRLPASGPGAVCELQAGDLVVVSPLPRPVEGMALRMRDNADSDPTGTQFGTLAARPSSRAGVPPLPQHAPAAAARTSLAHGAAS